jgi:hypothetical protein
MAGLLPLFNVLLPHLLAFYKDLRTDSPGQPALTDAEIIDMLGSDAKTLRDKATAWLAAHPPTT